MTSHTEVRTDPDRIGFDRPRPRHRPAPVIESGGGAGFSCVAEHVARARSRNPLLEFWFDCHPRFQALHASAESAVCETLQHFGPSPRGASELAAQFTGVTTNPNLMADYDLVLAQDEGRSGDRSAGTRDVRYRKHVVSAAEAMRPMHQSSQGRYGWVSAQVNPASTFDSHGIVEEGLALASLADNVMVKVPGSAEGYRAIRTLVAAGVSVNGTLSFGLAQFEAFAVAVAAGRAGLSEDEDARVRTVVTHMAGRVGDAVRAYHPALATIAGRDLRLAEAALARQGSQLVSAIEPRSSVLLSSVRTDPCAAEECLHLSATLDLPVAYTIKPDTYVKLQEVGLEAVFGANDALRDEAASFVPGPDAPDVLRPLFNRALPADQFWTLPQFLQTLAEASSSHVKLIGGRHAA